MPKRVIDFDALWASDKIATCAEWAQAEYAWLYGLADASGSFEITNLRVIWGRVAAIRSSFTIERLTATFDEFIAHGLLFTWSENGKRYGHWTGSDVPGRLPPPSWRARLERLAPPVPQSELIAYVSRYGSRRRATQAVLPQIAEPAIASAVAGAPQSCAPMPRTSELQPTLEAAQAQEWDLDLDLSGKREEIQVSASSPASAVPREAIQIRTPAERSPEELVQIFEEERGGLPAAHALTPELRRQCVLRIAAGLVSGEFRMAVRRAAATPFLSGSGGRGWCATFDWFMANDTNVRKVLDGRYEPSGPRRTISEAQTGAAPVAAMFGARVSAAALERIRARDGTSSQLSLATIETALGAEAASREAHGRRVTTRGVAERGGILGSIKRAERTPEEMPSGAGPEIGFGTKRVGVLLDRLRLHLQTDRFLAERRRDPVWEVACDYAVLALGRLASRLCASARDASLVSEVAALKHGAAQLLARRSDRAARPRRLPEPPKDCALFACGEEKMSLMRRATLLKYRTKYARSGAGTGGFTPADHAPRIHWEVSLAARPASAHGGVRR